MTYLRTSRVAIAALCLVALCAPIAFAEQDVIKLAERLNKKAMEDYDLLEFESARQSLQSALNKLREEGQDETRTAAKVYVSLGMVYIAGFKDRSRGVQQFVEALKIDGTAELDPERATPELQEAFEEAKKKAPKPTRETGTPEPIPLPPDNPGEAGQASGLVHTPIDEAKVGMPVTVEASLGRDIAAQRLFLFYQTPGQDDYQSVPMEKRGNRFFGTIPGEAIAGRNVHYYLEARDAKNRPVTAAGSAASPYIITVVQPEGARPEGDGSVDPCAGSEDPLCRAKQEKWMKKEEEGRGWGRLFLNLMVGTGAGIEVSGNQFEVAYQYHSADGTHLDGMGKSIGYFRPLTVGGTGFAWSGIHGALELGVNITRHVGVSLVGRLEGTLLNNADSSGDCPNPDSCYGATSKTTIAPAGMARFRYTFLEGRLKPTLHVGIGGGYVRHVLDVTEAGHHIDTSGSLDPPLADAGTAAYYAGQTGGKPTDPKTAPNAGTSLGQNLVCPPYPQTCYDTINIGYVLTSVGFELYYDLTQWKNGGFGLVADTDVIFGYGQQFGVNFDLQVGVGAHFL